MKKKHWKWPYFGQNFTFFKSSVKIFPRNILFFNVPKNCIFFAVRSFARIYLHEWHSEKFCRNFFLRIVRMSLFLKTSQIFPINFPNFAIMMVWTIKKLGQTLINFRFQMSIFYIIGFLKTWSRDSRFQWSTPDLPQEGRTLPLVQDFSQYLPISLNISRYRI